MLLCARPPPSSSGPSRTPAVRACLRTRQKGAFAPSAMVSAVASGGARKPRRAASITLEVVAVNINSWHRRASEIVEQASKKAVSLICVAEAGLSESAVPSATRRAMRAGWQM
eukprot:13748436-Alexandrium_andersonii.AAC.1